MKSQSKYYSNIKSSSNLDWVCWDVLVLFQDFQRYKFSLKYFLKSEWRRLSHLKIYSFNFKNLSLSVWTEVILKPTSFELLNFSWIVIFIWKYIVKKFLSISFQTLCVIQNTIISSLCTLWIRSQTCRNQSCSLHKHPFTCSLCNRWFTKGFFFF